MVYGIEVIKIMCSLNKIKLCPKVGDIYQATSCVKLLCPFSCCFWTK